jgi:hypothetical protein
VSIAGFSDGIASSFFARRHISSVKHGGDRAARGKRRRCSTTETHHDIGRQPAAPNSDARSGRRPGTSSGWLMNAHLRPNAVACSATLARAADPNPVFGIGPGAHEDGDAGR